MIDAQFSESIRSMVAAPGARLSGRSAAFARRRASADPELGTGVLERLMREFDARTDIGGSRNSRLTHATELSPPSC